MSEENIDRTDEQKDDDVEVHGFGNIEGMENIEAKEEPPDVEGHGFTKAVDPRPIDP